MTVEVVDETPEICELVVVGAETAAFCCVDCGVVEEALDGTWFVFLSFEAISDYCVV